MEGRRVRELRAGLGLSQERFAQQLGVSLQTVRRWESGLSKPLPILSLKLEELQRQAAVSTARVGGVRMMGTAAKGGLSVDLGIGGLLKGLGSLLDLVARMAEEGTEESARPALSEAEGSGKVEALGGKLKGVYGFSVRMGIGGKPVIEQFGNLRDTEGGPIVAEIREPLVDVLDEGDRVAVIAELPGVQEQDIQVQAHGDILEITAGTGDRRYEKEVLLPSVVEPASLESTYRNGVLQVRLAKRSDGEQSAVSRQRSARPRLLKAEG